jgi:hypothetical protein
MSNTTQRAVGPCKKPSSQPSIADISFPFSMAGLHVWPTYVQRCVYACTTITDHKSYKRRAKRGAASRLRCAMPACQHACCAGLSAFGFTLGTGSCWRVTPLGPGTCAGVRSSVNAKITHLGDVCGYAFCYKTLLATWGTSEEVMHGFAPGVVPERFDRLARRYLPHDRTDGPEPRFRGDAPSHRG